MNQPPLSFRHFSVMEGEDHSGTSTPVLQLIAGDASDRKFYRLRNARTTAICMRFPKWEGGYGGDPISWLGMQRVLLEMGIPVPQILAIDEDSACIWTEDFGDDFLNCRLGEARLDDSLSSCAETIDFYKQAIALVLKCQYPSHAVADHPALHRAFDSEKLMFEMDFFFTHFVAGFLSIPLEDSKEFSFSKVHGEMRRLCRDLGSRERVLTHRDYHVRNVMIVDGVAKWIDFQDARMGPHTYDIVSLLRDSYVKFSPDTRRHLSMVYFNGLAAERAKRNLSPITLEAYQSEFVRMGLQRNIKAIGSFGYLATLKNKPSYLRYVNHTLETIVSESADADAAFLAEYAHTLEFLNSLLKGPLSEKLSTRLLENGVPVSF